MGRVVFMDRRAADIKPGHITLDGVVLDVEAQDEQVLIRHRNVTYAQAWDSNVQVFGKVPADVVDIIKQAIREDH